LKPETRKLKDLLRMPVFNECCTEHSSSRCSDDIQINRNYVDLLIEFEHDGPLSDSLKKFIERNHHCYLKEGNHYEIRCNEYDMKIYFKSKENLDPETVHLMLEDFIRYLKLGLELTFKVKNIETIWYLYAKDYSVSINS
jgi:hypothetical protein